MSDFLTMHSLKQNIQKNLQDHSQIKAQEKDRLFIQITMIEHSSLIKTLQNLSKRNLNFLNENRTS